MLCPIRSCRWELATRRVPWEDDIKAKTHLQFGAALRSAYNDFDITLTPLASLAPTNTVIAVPCRAVSTTQLDTPCADWRAFGVVMPILGL